MRLRARSVVLLVLSSVLFPAVAVEPSIAPCVVTTPIGPADNEAFAIAVQPDGKIVVAGYADNGANEDFAVVRYNRDFTLDTSFDGDGIVTTAVGTGHDRAHAVAIQSDGKIVVAGYASFGANRDVALVRYNANGSLDTTFDGDGIRTLSVGLGSEEIHDLAIQTDGRLVAAGHTHNGANFDVLVTRFHSNGSLDTSFDADGIVTTDLGGTDQRAEGVTLQADGRIVIAGTHFNLSDEDILVVRYNTSGSLDVTFDGDGIFTDSPGASEQGKDVAVQPDGRILVVGQVDMGAGNDLHVIRILPGGGLDASFGSFGRFSMDIGPNDLGETIILQPDGRILVGGQYDTGIGLLDMIVARLKPDGSLDPSFGSGGTVTFPFAMRSDYGRGLAIESDGRILLAGSRIPTVEYDFAVVRVNRDGSSTCRSTTLHPTGPGATSSFSSRTGCALSWDCANDQAGNAATGPAAANDGLTSYLRDNAGASGKESFSLADGTIPPGSKVIEIEVHAAVGRGGALLDLFELTYQRIGFDPVPVRSTTLSADNPCCADVRFFRAGNLDWTTTHLDALEIGVEHVGTQILDVSQMYVRVLYAAPEPKVNYRSIGTAPNYAVGSVSVVNGSPIVTGSGTSWRTANRGRGDRIDIEGADYVVLSVDSETQLTLTSPFAGATGSPKPYTLSRQAPSLAAWEDCIDGGPCLSFPVGSPSLIDDNRREVGIVYKDNVFGTVVIDGSITDVTHDIVLTADAGNRHLGLRTAGVVINGGGAGVPGIDIRDDHVTVEWMEIRETTGHGIAISSLGASNRIVLRNNLIHILSPNGIRNNAAGALLDIYNNIVYNVSTAISLGAPLDASVLNNTLYLGGGNGVTSTGGSVTLRNNISHSFAGVSYNVAGIAPASSHNLSSDGTAATHSPGGGSKNNVPLTGAGGVNFVSTTPASENLHITSASAARDAGATLTLFGNDIDGAARLGIWDMGADEFGAPTPFRINYRSIGTNTGILASAGTASALLGATTVTFSSALPMNVGLGDQLTLDPGGANQEIHFILSRDSGTQVTLQTQTAFAHSGRAYTIRRAYNTLQGWETARQGNLVADNRREVGVAYNDGIFTAGVEVKGSVTDSSRYMMLTVSGRDRHRGRGATGVRVDGGNTAAGEIKLFDPFSVLEWFEVYRVRGASATAVRVGAPNVLLNQLLVHESTEGVRLSGSGGNSFTIRNSVVYLNDNDGIEGDEVTDSVLVENCTVYGNGQEGVDQSAGTPFVVRNTISMNNASGDFGISGAVQSNNISSDGTASGAGSLTLRAAVNQFVSLIPGAEDFHLKAGADAIDTGADLSTSFTIDMDGQTRPNGAQWDIGADELGGGFGMPTFSSSSSQTFAVGSAPTVASTMTITEDPAIPTITAANDLRIRIPSTFPMRFDPTQTTVFLGGTAGGKVSGSVTYEDFDRTVVLDVTADFAAGETLTVDNLRFWSFTAPASADNLQLEVENDDVVSALNDKTVTLVADANPNLSSDDNQRFVKNQAPVAASPFTITEGTTPGITLGNDIRVRIPAGFNMTWDPSVTTISVSGTAAGLVSTTVSYADANRTLVIDVTANFAAGQFIRVTGPLFQGFTPASAVDNLELDTGSAVDFDDKTIVIEEASDVQFFTATATNGQVKLEWRTPKTGACTNVLVIVKDNGVQPANPTDFDRIVDNRPCVLDSYDSVTDGTPPLTNGNLYAYAAFVDYGPFTPGQFVKARPMDTAVQPVKWAYSTGATTMVPPGLRFKSGLTYVYAVSNDDVLHAMNGGAGGGDWPSGIGWKPYALGAPAQARPPVVGFSVGTAMDGVAFVGSQDGHVHAVDAKTGTALWKNPAAAMVQAAPTGHFSFFDASAFDIVIVGTRVSGAPNSLEAMSLAAGAPVWSFTNSAAQLGDGKEIGLISGTASIQYSTKRIFFASREGTGAMGSTDTLWCVDFSSGSPQLVWSVALGDIDGSPVLFNGRLYVGTNGGVLHSVDPWTGALNWSFAIGDGPVKGFPFPHFGYPRVIVATTNKITSVEDAGGTYNPVWQLGPSDVPSPSTPIYLSGGGKILVGSGDGHLYQLDALSPLPSTRLQLGAGTSAVGVPAFDVGNLMIYVGTDEGMIYGITYPLP